MISKDSQIFQTVFSNLSIAFRDAPAQEGKKKNKKS